ncbi:MAG: hypothetical protein V4712_17780 [Pseudomonadota bacterium]
MREGFGGFTGFSRRRGGAAAPAAPAFVTMPTLFGELLSGRTLEIAEFSHSGTEPVTTSFQWGSIAGGDDPGDIAATYALTDAHYGLVIYCDVTLTNAAGSVTERATASAVVGKQFAEDWAAFAVGNTETQVLAGGFTRNNTTWLASVVASAIAPAVKALTWTESASATRGAWRNDIDTFGGAHAFAVYEELFLIEHTGGITPTFFLRPRDAALNLGAAGPGVNIRANVVRHQMPGEDEAAATGVTVETLTAAQQFWVRQQVEGAVSRVRIWDFGLAEPELWSSVRTHGGAMAGLRGPALGVRASGGSETCHYYSCGYNAPAPYWPDYVPPSPETGDLMSYAASSGSSTITMAGGEIVWSVA